PEACSPSGFATGFPACLSHSSPMSYQVRLTSILLTLFAFEAIAADSAKRNPPTMAELLASSKPADWRLLDPENTLYIDFAAGRVVIELAPDFAPRHVANVKTLTREHYHDGLAVVRAQDNYVVQMADPDAEKPNARKIQNGKKTLPPEFDRPLD